MAAKTWEVSSLLQPLPLALRNPLGRVLRDRSKDPGKNGFDLYQFISSHYNHHVIFFIRLTV